MRKTCLNSWYQIFQIKLKFRFYLVSSVYTIYKASSLYAYMYIYSYTLSYTCVDRCVYIILCHTEHKMTM